MTPSAQASMAERHANNPDLAKEHMQAMKLVSGQPTHVAKQNGSWFDPSTWQGGKIPGNNAKVLIQKGVNVNYDRESDARLFTVNVEGQLSFATDKDTKMVVDTLVVNSDGKLEIGTKGNPVKAGVNTEILIADNGKINLNWDPAQLSRGLVSHGAVEIHGQAKTSHLKVATNPRAGDRTLTLSKTPANWQVGDRIVLTGTRFLGDFDANKWTSEDEEVVIESINGNRVTLDRALKYDHTTPRSDLKAYVSNLSRNIVIASENGDSLPTQHRGHTIFMHSDDVDVRYAEFKNLGRTDKTKPLDDFKLNGSDRARDGNGNPIPGARTNIRGRYAVHAHRTGINGKPAIFVGNTIDDSPGWGLAIHDSNAIVENNATFDIKGAAFVTESGNEKGTFRNNIAIKTGPGTDRHPKTGVDNHDLAFSGEGIWLQGRMFENEGNVVANSRGAGIFYFHRGADQMHLNPEDLPVPGIAKSLNPDDKVHIDKVAIQGFKNNEVFASGTGLSVLKDFPVQNHDLRTVLDGFKGWEVEQGTELEYTSHYTLRNFDLIGAKQSAHSWKDEGIFLQQNIQDFVFDNLSIEGFDRGVNVQGRMGDGVKPLKDRGFFWIDLKLKNNKTDFENFSPAPSTLLKRSDLNPGTLSFDLSKADSDFVVNGEDFQGGRTYVSIRGTKRDSLGEIEMPFGNELLDYNYSGISKLAEKGYYTLPDGTRATVIEEYFADRVTGEAIKVPFVVTFNRNENWWTDGSPYLGKLNPDSLGGAQRVNLPKSRYRLNQSPIKPVTPITPPVSEPPEPTPPVAEEPPAPEPPEQTPVPTPPIEDAEPTIEPPAPVDPPKVEPEAEPPVKPPTSPSSKPPAPSAESSTIRIEAEDYARYKDIDRGNNGRQFRTDDVDIEVTSDKGGGYNVGWVRAGEWLEYDVTLPEAGTYEFVARTASDEPGNKTLEISIDGKKEQLVSASTGGWQKWADSSRETLTLEAGAHKLRIQALNNDFNINYIEVKQVDKTTGGAEIARSLTQPSEKVAPKSPMSPSDSMRPSRSNLQPVLSYDFENGVGRVVSDRSTTGQTHNGRLNGDVSWAEGVGGSDGLALEGGRVDIANTKDINLQMHRQRTLSLWFKPENLPTNGQKQVIYEEGGVLRGLNFYLEGDRLYFGGWNQPDGESNWEGTWLETDGIKAGEWHHAALVLDGDDTVQSKAMTAYLNGEQVDQGAGSQLWAHGNQVALGAVAGQTRFESGISRGSHSYMGTIDEAQIYNQALTGEQVQAIASQF